MPTTVSLIAGKLDDLTTLPLLGPNLDAIVNSANNHLLTPGATGIAGAIRDLGGPSVQHACDAEKARAGGEVALGHAVWTTSGELGCRCGIAHAVTLRYTPQREPTTPEAVASAFQAALALADAHGARRLACYVMCARPGYSTVSGDDAPRVMLGAMLTVLATWAEPPPSAEGDGGDRRVYLFVPTDAADGVPRLLLRGLAAAPPSATLGGGTAAVRPPLVWWCDSSLGRKGPAFERLRAAGVVLELLLEDNASVLERAGAGPMPWALVTCRSRPLRAAATAEPTAGVALLEALGGRVPGPKVLYCGGEPDAACRVGGWLAGASWVTHDLPRVEALLLASLAVAEGCE